MNTILFKEYALHLFIQVQFLTLVNEILAAKNYRALWTGMGAQLARDVPFSAICWSTLEPVRIWMFSWIEIILFCNLLHSMFNWASFIFIGQKKTPWIGRWWSWRSQCAWGQLFCRFCCWKSCCCHYMSAGCCKNPTTDRGFFPSSYIALSLRVKNLQDCVES